MKIFEFDIWDSDKGLILAESEEKAIQILKDEYLLDYNNPKDSEWLHLGYVCETTDKGLFVME